MKVPQHPIKTTRIGLSVAQVTIAAFALLASLTVPTSIANAQMTYVVTSTADSGAGSLRQAVLDANGNSGSDIIEFDSSLSGQTISLTGGTISVTENLTIKGLGADNLAIDSASNGAQSALAFNSVTAVVDGITFKNGSAELSGALFNDAGALTIQNCRFQNNSSSGFLIYAGAIASVKFSGSSSPSLHVINTVFDGNSTSRGASAIYSEGMATIEGSTFTDNTNGSSAVSLQAGGSVTNSAFSGNTGSNAGAISSFGSVPTTILNSTFFGNSAGDGGAVSFVSSVGSTIRNSTFSGNTAETAGGAIDVESSSLTLTNSTVTGNTATNHAGGGIYGANSTITIESSVVANNTAPKQTAPSHNDISLSTTTLTSTNSLIEDPAGHTVVNGVDGNIVGVDPQLLTLADNGGVTQTHALSATSPAINTGSNPASLPNDQRGAGFPRVVGASADMGAFEVQSFAEIDVKGNGISIADDDSTPSSDDNTDFGSMALGQSPIVKTFTIENTGTATLNLSGTPRVAVSGTHAADFAVTTEPSSTVAVSDSTTFKVTFDAAELGVRTASLSIANDDSDENPYTFAIQGSAQSGTDTDGDGDPDVTDPDDDNDGVSDTQEMADGTDPLDPGSAVERSGSEACVEWNGYIDFLVQILELRNSGSSDITLDLTLLNNSGTALSSEQFTLSPGRQRDIVLNTLNGFSSNNYGLVCVQLVSGPTDAIAGQLSVYRFTATSYSLAYAADLLVARSGPQYHSYNTFRPGTNLADADNFVAGWIQVLNDETTEQTGSLRYYDAEGFEIRVVPVTIAPKGRIDVDTHSVGGSRVGLVAWEPSSSTAKFRVRQNRYYFGASGLSDLLGAISLSATLGSGATLFAPFDTQNGFVTVELSNVSDSPITVSVDVHDSNGVPTSAQPGALSIPAKGNRGLILNDYLAAGLGRIKIHSSATGSLIATTTKYRLDASGILQSADPSSPQEPVGRITFGSYNSFLNQDCRLRVVNATSAEIETTPRAEFTMTRYDGTVLVNKQALTIAANGVTEVDLCGNENIEAYGEVKLEAYSNGIVVADIIRESSEGNIGFSSILKP